MNGLSFGSLAVISLGISCLLNVTHGDSPIILKWFSKENRKDPNGLYLSTSIMSVNYCSGDAETLSLHLKLRLRYTNQTQHRLILGKPDPTIASGMVSRNAEQAKAGKYEVVLNYDVLTSADNRSHLPSTPDQRFFILGPSETFETNGFIAIVLRRDDARAIPGTIPPGEHVLQVEIATWPGSALQARKLRQRWRSYGLLHSDVLISEPMSFTVKSNPPISDCAQN